MGNSADYTVYILLSEKGRRYIGFTSNLSQRIAQHNRKHKGFTATSKLWQIEISKMSGSKKEAMELETYLKSLKNSKKALEYLQSVV